MTTTLTDLEFRALELFAHCEMNTTNGATPTSHHDVYTYLWADERAANLGISGQAMGGVLTSLGAKGLALIEKPAPKKGDPDGGFHLTEAGFEAWMAERKARNLEVRS